MEGCLGYQTADIHRDCSRSARRDKNNSTTVIIASSSSGGIITTIGSSSNESAEPADLRGFAEREMYFLLAPS